MWEMRDGKRNSEVLGALAYEQDGFGPTLEDVRKGLIGKIGENMSFRRFKRFAGNGKLASYLHGTRIGVMVEFEGDDTAAKDVAMHIAAMKPAALSSADVPAVLVEKERKIAAEKAAESGKPAEIVAKMVEGSVQKFLKEVSLLDQVRRHLARGQRCRFHRRDVHGHVLRGDFITVELHQHADARAVKVARQETALMRQASAYQRYVNEWEGVRDDEFTPFKGSSGFAAITGIGHRSIIDTVASAIGHGLCTRFPGLKITPVENGSGWVRPLLHDMEQAYAFNPHLFEEDPVQVFKRNIFVHPFHEYDPKGLVGVLGADNVLFGSEYPLPEGMADPVSFVDELEGLPHEDVTKVMGGNLARLLNVA